MKKSSAVFAEARRAVQASEKFMKQLVAAEKQLDALLVLASKGGSRTTREAERVFDLFSRLRDDAFALDAKYGIAPEGSLPKRGGRYRDLLRAERRAGLLKRKG